MANFNRLFCRPSRNGKDAGAPNAPDAAAGVDVIVGDLPAMVQAGSSGTFVGLAVATTSCNNGTQEFNWFALPNTDHPVIPQNLYRMSGGTSNTDRFEQVGQSWLKHAFTALQQNVCGFGCVPHPPLQLRTAPISAWDVLIPTQPVTIVRKLDSVHARSFIRSLAFSRWWIKPHLYRP